MCIRDRSYPPRGLPAGRGQQPVVRDFSARIQRGDRIGVIGPNGAGKTTLLRLDVYKRQGQQRPLVPARLHFGLAFLNGEMHSAVCQERARMVPPGGIEPPIPPSEGSVISI